MRLDTKSSKKDQYSLESNQCVCADGEGVSQTYKNKKSKSLDTADVVRDVEKLTPRNSQKINRVRMPYKRSSLVA